MTTRPYRLAAVLIAFVATALLSCGGEEAVDDGEPLIGIKILAGECNTGDGADYIDGGNISDKLGSLAIQFYTATGTLVKVGGKNAVSLKNEELSESVKITGIPDISNARVVFSGFEMGNISSPKWRGEVRDVNFTKGKTTAVTVVLYPVAGLGCFPKPLSVPRFGHTVTELTDGRILISGGFTELSNGIWQATDSVELLDPESGAIDQIAGMAERRALHIAVLLPDGRVIFTGGVTALETKKMSVTDYPDMPLALSFPAKGVEVYTVGLSKVNQRTSDIDESVTDFINDSSAEFFPFQSYAYVRSDETTGNGTIFMAGGVSNGTAVTSIYGIDITVGDPVSVTINQKHADKPLVAPLMAAAGSDKALIIGGHKASDTKFAHFVSNGTYDEWTGEALPNLFFGAIKADLTNDTIIAASGLELPNGAGGFSMNNKGYKISPSLSVRTEGTLFWGTWLHDIAINAADNYFSVSGGTIRGDISESTVEGNQFFENVDFNIMDFNQATYEYTKRPRLFHRIIMTADKRTYLIGGIEDLKGTTLLDTIEILQMGPIQFAPPPPVVTVTSDAGDTTPTWEWTTPKNATGSSFQYRLVKIEDNNSETEEIPWTQTSSTSFTAGSPLSTGKHRFEVQAADGNGWWSVSGSAEVVL